MPAFLQQTVAVSTSLSSEQKETLRKVDEALRRNNRRGATQIIRENAQGQRDDRQRLAFGRGQRNPRPQPFRVPPSYLKLHKIDGSTLLREDERIQDKYVPMGGGEVDQAVQTSTRIFQIFCIIPSLLWGNGGQIDVAGSWLVLLIGFSSADRVFTGGFIEALIIDSLAQAISFGKYRERKAVHEAGHFLVAYLLGILPAEYALTAFEATKKFGLFGGVQAGTQLCEYDLQHWQCERQRIPTILHWSTIIMFAQLLSVCEFVLSLLEMHYNVKKSPDGDQYLELIQATVYDVRQLPIYPCFAVILLCLKCRQTSLRKGRIDATQLESLCAIALAGIAAEVVSSEKEINRIGESEPTGGMHDLLSLDALLSLASMPNKERLAHKRFGLLTSVLLLRQHQEALFATAAAMNANKPVVEVIKVIESTLQRKSLVTGSTLQS